MKWLRWRLALMFDRFFFRPIEKKNKRKWGEHK